MTSRWTTLFSAGIVLVVLFVTANSALGHSGGTDANGCHAGSQPYHCHGSRTAPVRPAPSGGLTLCADGTYSQSSGSGTCSWHGGIAGNNNPSTGSSSSSGGGGTGRIVPGTGTAGTSTQAPQRPAQNSPSSDIVGSIAQWWLLIALGGWGLIAASKRSQSEPARPATQAKSFVPPKPSGSGSVASSRAPAASSRQSKGSNNSANSSSVARASTAQCSCGGREVVRRNRKTGHRFYGCSRYPSCKRTRPLR